MNTNDLPEIVNIMHVPVFFRELRVAISPKVEFYRFMEDAFPHSTEYETIQLYQYGNEKFKYGYGRRSHVLVIADRIV